MLLRRSAWAAFLLLTASCGRAGESDGRPPELRPLEAAIAARDEAAYQEAVNALVSTAVHRPEVLDRLAESLAREERENVRWPGKLSPSGGVLLRLGRAAVRPLLRGFRTYAEGMLRLGALPDVGQVTPWDVDAEQEAELVVVFLSRAEAYVDRVEAIAWLGSLPRPMQVQTLRDILGSCNRGGWPEDGHEHDLYELYLRHAVYHNSLRGMDNLLEALPWVPACGKRFALEALARAGTGSAAALRMAEALSAEADPALAAEAAAVWAVLGGDAVRARAVVEAALARREPAVLAAAAAALRDWPGHDAWVVETLERLIRSENEFVSQAAYGALGWRRTAEQNERDWRRTQER